MMRTYINGLRKWSNTSSLEYTFNSGATNVLMQGKISSPHTKLVGLTSHISNPVCGVDLQRACSLDVFLKYTII